MRVLVTGASGFVGGYLTEALATGGHEVLAVSRGHARQPPGMGSRIRPLRLDLAQGDEWATEALDAVIHCAAAIPASVSDEGELLRINRHSARRVFDHATRSGARKIVFCSSMAAFGRIEDDLVGPDTPIREPGAYGISKLEGEALLASSCARHAGVAGLSIRLPGIVGPGSHHNFLSDTMARLLGGEAVTARNPDAPFNNVVHVAELAAFVMACLKTLPNGHSVTTLCSTEPLAIRSVVAIMEREAGCVDNVSYEEGGRPFLLVNDAERLGFRAATVTDSVTRFAREARDLRRAGV